MAYIRKPKSKAQIAIDRALGPKESTPRGPRKPSLLMKHAPTIKAVKDAAVSGYAHAFVITRPWMVVVDGVKLLDNRRRPRRFATEAAAIAAATKRR